MADEWEDDMIVYVELAGGLGGQLIPSGAQNPPAEILGIATDRPVLHINGQDFVGHYEDSLGTSLLMGKKDTGGEPKKLPSRQPSMEFVCKTDKKLVMQPAFLMEKTSAGSEPASQEKATQPGNTMTKDTPSTVTKEANAT